MALSNVGFLVLLIIGVVAWKIMTSTRASTSAPLPPGPPADPIIGHVRIVPSSRPELSYQKWAKEYNSDVLYLNFMGQPAIILNSAQSAVDLMDKRSSIYSDRPDFHFFEESGWKDVLTFSKAGPAFRKHRKIFQNAFSPTNIVQYREKQEDLARGLLKQMVRKPEQWRGLLTTFASSLVLAIAYGIRITDENDPYIILTEKIAWLFANGGSPGATFVDIVPMLRRLPAWVKVFPSLNFARDSIPIVREFIEAPFASVKRGMESGTPEISFARRMLEEKESASNAEDADDVTEDDIKGAASTMYAAGADTTLSTLVIFVLCMLLNPEAQEKARRELDRVIGRDRLPRLSDRGKLPCIDRIFHETARQVNIHLLTVIWICLLIGFLIDGTLLLLLEFLTNLARTMFTRICSSQKGREKTLLTLLLLNSIPTAANLNKNRSLVMANAYAITHDAAVYTDPDKFYPDRYLPVSEGGAGEPLPVGHFGFGRR
jgi:cytochrome P450